MDYKLGDTVAVFLDREASGATIANTGLVVGVRPRGALVYVPNLDSYCLADDETLIKCDQMSGDPPATFAEIVFEQCCPTNCSGTYRKLNGCKTIFEFVLFDGHNIGFDYDGEIGNDGISLKNPRLVVRMPSTVVIAVPVCTQILRQILNTEYTKIRTK